MTTDNLQIGLNILRDIEDLKRTKEFIEKATTVVLGQCDNANYAYENEGVQYDMKPTGLRINMRGLERIKGIVYPSVEQESNLRKGTLFQDIPGMVQAIALSKINQEIKRLEKEFAAL